MDAFRIAERVRASIADMSIIVPGATGGERVHVTVSIGVAALDSGCKREYSELMAAADAALYRAKSGGRDQVQMISTTRGLSAISGADLDNDDSAKGGRPDAPSVFRRAQISLAGPPAGPVPMAAEASTEPQPTVRMVRAFATGRRGLADSSVSAPASGAHDVAPPLRNGALLSEESSGAA